MNTQTATLTSPEVELIQSCGYRVFMRKPTDEYCFFTDGTRIGYAQWSGYRTSVSSVHVGSRENGTGFGVADSITPESIKAAAEMVMPNWATGSVRKYRSWDEYIAESDWNAGLTEVPQTTIA